MPPKTKANGFYMYMLAEQKKLKSLTNRAPNIREMAGLCTEQWKRLSEGEKNKFEILAKKERERLQNTGDAQYGKLDCHRNLISDRKDPVKEEYKRRNQEKQALQNSWHDQDTRDVVFHIIDFQVMYDERMESHYPLEIGIVSFTLRKGVLNFMHRFIDPGEVPQGNRHLAISHSENTHKIPLNFEHGDANIKALTTHVTDFLRADSGKDDIPPVFCLAIHRHLIENCLDFVYGRSFVNELNKIQKVYCLEDLVTCLIANTGKEEKSVSESQVSDMLCQNRWDYNSSIRCFYHEELDCSFCSLSIVRRYSFALFDILSILLQFSLTDKHLPDETEQNYTVTESIGFGRQNYSSANDWRNRSGNNSQSSFTNRTMYPPAPRENAWQPPKVEPVKVELSDEDSGNEEEEPETTEYTYRKLRLPKSLAQVQSQVGQMGLQPGIPEKSAWGVPAAAAPVPNPVPRVNPAPSAAPTRPMGRGMAPSKLAQLRPMGQAQAAPPPGFSAPPGFGPRPGFAMGAPISQTPGAPGFPPLFSGPSEDHFPALGRGRGLIKGRAWPHNKN